MLSHEVQKGLLSILNFSEGSSGVAWLKLSPRLVNSLCLKAYMCTVNPLYHLAKISRFSMLLITYRQCVTTRNLSALRSSLGRYPCWRGEPGMQPETMQESFTGPRLLIECDDWLVCKRSGSLFQAALDYHIAICPPKSGISWIQPS